MTPPRYPSDLSDEEWAILEPLLSRSERRGRPPKWPARRVADAAAFYLLRSGCSWGYTTPAGGEAQEATERPETSGECRSWWSRMFGG